MIKSSDSYIDGYIKLAWVILATSPQSPPPSYTHIINLYNHFQARYGAYIKNLVINSQLSSTNLIISLYYLYKHYHKNSIVCTKLDKPQQNAAGVNEVAIDPTHIYMIITSLILSNKSFDDQSYTLKTWLIIINNTSKNYPYAGINVDLALLNTMESYFLSSVDFQLSFIGMSDDAWFWSLFERHGGMVDVDEVTVSMFKSLAGCNVAEVDAIATPMMIPPQPQSYQLPYLQPYEQQSSLQPPTIQPSLQPSLQPPTLQSQFVAPPFISVNSITPPPQLTTSMCSPLENNTTFSSYYLLTPTTPLDYCCKRRKLEQQPILPSQLLLPPPQHQPQPQQVYYSQPIQPQYIQPQQWSAYQVPLPCSYW